LTPAEVDPHRERYRTRGYRHPPSEVRRWLRERHGVSSGKLVTITDFVT
jgi:hypothetical protein